MPKTLFVSTRKGLFEFHRRGKGNWRAQKPAFLGSPVTMTLQDPRDGRVYLGLDLGHFGPKLHCRSGKTWREIATPEYPLQPEGERDQDAIGRPWPWKMQKVWSLEIDPVKQGAIWCGTIPGGLFHSADRGATWLMQRGLWDHPMRRKWSGGGFDLPGIHSVCVHPQNPDTVSVAISSGGVWRTDDHGASWRNISKGMKYDFMPPGQNEDPNTQDPHRVVQCKAAPDRLWAQHHCGIFRTDDAGEQWREIKAKAPSRFGFPCAVHPEDPDTAWFVPAVKDECRVPVGGRLVVTRTKNAGKTFEVLARGLPAPSWDLVFRHGLDLAADGKSLAMGSTGGGLWVSEDGGKGWTELSAHLPPIYAVRFGAE